MKTCTKCKVNQSESEFYKSSASHDGLTWNCKTCRRAWQKQRRETIVAAKAEVRQRLGISAPISTPDRRQQALKLHKLSTDISARLYAKQRGMCPCCNRPLGRNYHIDHIMPIALGGTNTDDNVQLLRASCNAAKGASHPDAFRDHRKRQREYRKIRAMLNA